MIEKTPTNESEFEMPVSEERDQSLAGELSQPIRSALFVWGLVRVPLIFLILYVFRDNIAALPLFDGVAIILRVIDILSLPLSRIILCLAIAGVLGLVIWSSLRLQPMRGYILLVSGTAIVVFFLFGMTGTPLKYALIPILLAAANFLPEALLARRADNRLMAIGVGITEALILRRHLNWLAELSRMPHQTLRWVRLAGWALASLLVSICAILLVKGDRLVAFEQSLRMPESASVVFLNDLNGLALDRAQGRLFVTGHGLEYVHEFDLDDMSLSPRVADVSTGGAQGINFSSDNQELSLFNHDTKQLIVLDAGTLGLKRMIDASELASGDPWIAVDPISGTIALVSEADVDDGVAFLLLDRESGETLDTRDIDAGNILKHPNKPWLYLSFFRRNPEVLIYDMEQREIVLSAPAPARVDRVALLEDRNELLITSPATSEIVRLDADTLETKGSLKAPFGVRTLAFDSEREILFAGSFVTGQVMVIDMRTARPLGTVYLGPWLRSIELDTTTATAYVSSNGALYRWTYDNYR